MAETPEAQARDIVEGATLCACPICVESPTGAIHPACITKTIAAALRAAEARGRVAGIEAAAKVADPVQCSHPICHCCCRDVALEIAAAIRALAATDAARAGEEGNRG